MDEQRDVERPTFHATSKEYDWKYVRAGFAITQQSVSLSALKSRAKNNNRSTAAAFIRMVATAPILPSSTR